MLTRVMCCRWDLCFRKSWISEFLTGVHRSWCTGRNEAHRLLDLDDLSQAGFAESARQWLLLSRRSEFVDECGHHELWMRTGGSAGHSSAWSIDIQEGTLSNHMLGQKWKVKVRSCKSFIQEKEKQKEERTQDKLNSIISKIVDYLSKQPAGDTQTAIRESLELRGKIASEALNVAIERDWIKREHQKEQP